jgi:hypothetical protein
MTDARLIRTVDEWEAYRVSPHARHGHPERLSWCEWCIRLSAEETRLSVAPEAIPDDTLWGGATDDEP